ncbi:hypothetical protein EUTSA_v10012954mg [Eutrema salsugineum]|uniref:MBD domain-containing protein n=1 Tax=Eutrema salsugineum TaxID=72664 RepID=V4NBK5_EUTSA|nr:methyl-CpG-binding domain-containing protein 13 [Eutrema salsugineum]ESQ43301.1 hypothetical protein EUTSA_v10012954mg [Eutrema salsugineum]
MDGEGISDGLLADRKVEIRVRKNGRKDKVIVEKSTAEGLPEGWIKKLVISNRPGRKSRRDPFFIDPKSEYIFQSFKDASRYAETGDLGNYARKLKESDFEDDSSGNGKNVLLLESADDLLEKEKNRNISVRSSKRRNSSSSDEHSENWKMNSELSIVTSQVLEDLEKKEETKDPIEIQSIPKRVTRSQAKASKNEEDEDFKRKNLSTSNAKSEEDSVRSRLRSASSQSPEKKSDMKMEEVQDSTEKRITRSIAIVKKNELTVSVARRASKRLAGIELEPTPELKTRTKAQRVVPPDDVTSEKCKQPVSPVATGGLKKMDIPLNEEVAKSYNEQESSPKPNAAVTSNDCLRAETEEQVEKIWKPVGKNGSGDKKKMKTPLVISEAELNPVFHLDGYMQKEEKSPVSPLSRQTSATKREKTVAGKRVGRPSPKANKVTSPKATEISALRKNIVSNDIQSSVVRGASSEVMERNTNSFTSTFDSTLADLWKDPCIAFAIKTLTGESLHLPNTAAVSSDQNNSHAKQKGVAFSPETHTTGSEKPGVSSESPCMDDIWKDPCIDFAIKTLTGAIPIGLDEPGTKIKSEEMTVTATARQEQEGRQSSCDYLVQQCSSNMKKKTLGKFEDPRFPQTFSKD